MNGGGQSRNVDHTISSTTVADSDLAYATPIVGIGFQLLGSRPLVQLVTDLAARILDVF